MPSSFQRRCANGLRAAIEILEQQQSTSFSENIRETATTATTTTTTTSIIMENHDSLHIENAINSIGTASAVAADVDITDGCLLELWVDLEEQSIAEEGQVWLERFVSVVSQHRNLVKLWFYRGTFFRQQQQHPNGNDVDTNAVMERLLGEVLPRHRSLTCITFSWCHLQPAYVELLTGALMRMKPPELQGSICDTNNIHTIDLYQTKLEYLSVVAIANLLRSHNHNNNNNNANIEKLVLQACGITSEGCQAILEAANESIHLNTLELHGNDISDITFFKDTTTAAATAGVGEPQKQQPKQLQALFGHKNSTLKCLNLYDNPLTTESIHSLVEMLKTNVSLEQLRVSLCFDKKEESQQMQMLLDELLTTFNSSLQVLRINSNFAYSMVPSPHQQRIDDLLKRNQPARLARAHLMRQNYQLSHSSFWSHALERVSHKPSLLYQCLRQGHADLFLTGRGDK